MLSQVEGRGACISLLFCLPSEFGHPEFVVCKECISLLFLYAGSTADVFEREGSVDDYIFDAVEVEVPPLLEGVCDELGNLAVPEDGEYLFVSIFLLLSFGWCWALFVDFLAELAHGDFALLDGGEEGGVNHGCFK